jgi:hypothetical protein
MLLLNGKKQKLRKVDQISFIYWKIDAWTTSRDCQRGVLQELLFSQKLQVNGTFVPDQACDHTPKTFLASAPARAWSRRLLLRAPDLQLVRDDRDVIDTPWRNWVNLHFFHFLRKETNLGCLIISCCLTQRIWAKNLSLLSVSFSLSRHVLCGVRCIYEWSLLLVIFLTTHYVYTSTSHLTNIERSVFKEIFSSSSSS